jgi:hypothetical protein
VSAVPFRGDGSPVPTRWQGEPWEAARDLRHWGPASNLQIRLEPLIQSFLTSLTPRAEDLVRIAAYAYAADQSLPRGGETDVYGHAWSRHIGLCTPVSDPDFWNQIDVREALERTLGFVSGDRWEFSFSASDPREGQLLFPGTSNALEGRPDTVMLFSGGAEVSAPCSMR